MIKAIDTTSIHRICSSQVVVDLATAVKELVENALDAGATVVEIALVEYGESLIEVHDNAKGIDPEDYEGLAMKHHTSKIEQFEDLMNVSSYGFRGEALNSLCELSESFVVTTRRESDPAATKLTFDRMGRLKGQTHASRGIGTTVSIENLFQSLPVRRAEYIRNIKKQYQKMLRVIQAYALFATGVKIVLTNVTNGARQTVLSTQQTSRIDDNICTIFGSKFLSSLQTFSAHVHSTTTAAAAAVITDDDHNDRNNNTNGGGGSDGIAVTQDEVPLSPPPGTAPSRQRIGDVTGFISKIGLGIGRSDNDRQFIFCNSRPVDLPRVVKALNEVWRKYEMKQKPAFIVDIRINRSAVDVNLAPNKREVLIESEEDLIADIKQAVDAIYALSRNTLQVHEPTESRKLTSFANFASFSSSSSSSSAVVDRTPSSRVMSQYATEEKPSRPVETPGEEEGASQAAAVVARRLSTTFEEVAEHVPDDEGDDGSASVLQKPAAAPAAAPASAPAPVSVSATVTSTTSPAPGPTANSAASPAVSDHAPAPELATVKAPASASLGSAPLPLPASASSTTTPAVAPVAAPAPAPAPASASASAPAPAPEAPPPEVTWFSPTEQLRFVQLTASSQEAEYSSQNGATTTVSDVDSEAVWEPTPYESVPWTVDALFAPLTAAAVDADSKKRPREDDRAHEADRAVKKRRQEALSLTAEATGAGDVSSSSTPAAPPMDVRVIDKGDFGRMRILGQFNLGFILAELDGDMYILDQHACDEKFRFEALQRNTKIHQQPLLKPLVIEMTANLENVVEDHVAVFEANGFHLRIDEDAPVGQRVSMLTMPFSKGTQFGVNDVLELASLLSGEGDEIDGFYEGRINKNYISLRNEPVGPSQRPSSTSSSSAASASASATQQVLLPKVMTMFASRACRSAVMIGTALSLTEMRSIVQQMVVVEQPWNCPHGRPTMRHLFDYDALYQQIRGVYTDTHDDHVVTPDALTAVDAYLMTEDTDANEENEEHDNLCT